MMEEKEFKNLFEDSADRPSYGFSTKTMRKIEAYEASKIHLSTKGNKSVIVYLIPLVFLVLLLSSLFLSETQLSSFEFSFSFPDLKTAWMNFNFHFSWIIASIAIAAGFWSWIWWEKTNLSA